MDVVKMAELEALAGSLGNVLEACRRMGVSRSLFYKWLKSKAAGGGVPEAEPAEPETGKGKRRRHPHAVSEPLRKRALALAVENPEWGCDRISRYLSLHKQRISPTTVQKILIRNGLRTWADRRRAS
ncbi:MAG TPA: hypothetical protein VJ385_13960 [Fibrobacteria bacterium]|nr:hypothetical protein [Fibrobacteria bacterium]